jgi:hypothetical protein
MESDFQESVAYIKAKNRENRRECEMLANKEMPPIKRKKKTIEIIDLTLED